MKRELEPCQGEKGLEPRPPPSLVNETEHPNNKWQKMGSQLLPMPVNAVLCTELCGLNVNQALGMFCGYLTDQDGF